jgi:dihydrofolate synthase/folylpolyglutamate synthase
LSHLEDYLNQLTRKKNIFREQSFKKLKQVLVNLKIKKPNKIISITGTNGKGSTAEILSRVLANNKYEVGLLTSPHLVKFNERIRINNENIDDEEMLNCLEEVDKLKDSKELNFYQIIAAAAFLFFSKKKLDVWILEVGLGGRLDPANYFDADISVITKIALDHENILGKGVERRGEERRGEQRRGEERR